ncbi:large ribosomal subunit protein mL43-like [Dermacentor albipictus]|uniref:large ribosomal subunit protein mL43-like n=1 Tax=Dermacentor albipictus TaxID=60249 RepID=UPI0031FDD407
MAHKTITYIKAPLYNGVGRYVCQLQRLTLTFCKTHGSSRGMREYIERELVNFARENPGVVVYLKPRRHRDPYIVGEYLNGERDMMRANDLTARELVKWIDHFRTRSGEPIALINKYLRTDYPSIQGFWTPFTNRPTEQNLAKFPNEELGEFKSVFPSATEQLKELAAQDSPETSQAKE